MVEMNEEKGGGERFKDEARLELGNLGTFWL